MASADQQLRELRHAILEHELSGGGRNVEMRRQFNAVLRHHRQHPMQGGAPNNTALERVQRLFQEKVIKQKIKMFNKRIARLEPKVTRLQRELEEKMAIQPDIYTQIFQDLRTPAVKALEKIIDDQSGLNPDQKEQLKGLIRQYGSTQEWMKKEKVKGLYQLTTKKNRWNKIYQAGGIIPQPTGGFVIPNPDPTQPNPYLTLESMQKEYIKTFKDSDAHIMVITEPFELVVDGYEGIEMTHPDTDSCILYKTATIDSVETEGGDKYTITPHSGSSFTLYNFHGNSKDDEGKNYTLQKPSPNQTALRELVVKAKTDNPATPFVVCGDSNITRKKSGVSTQDELTASELELIYGKAVTYSDREIRKVRFPEDKDANVDILLNNQTTKIGLLDPEVDGMFIVCLDPPAAMAAWVAAGAGAGAATPLVALQSPYNKETNPILADHQVLTATTGGIKIMVANGAEATHKVKGWLPATAQASRDVILDIFKTYENFSIQIGVPFTQAWNEIYGKWQTHGFEGKEPKSTPPTILPQGLTLTTEQKFVDYWKPLEDAQKELQTTKKSLQEAERKLEQMRS